MIYKEELIIFSNHVNTDYHYFLGKYYSVTHDGSQIVVNFNSIKIYKAFKTIIKQNLYGPKKYGRNQFVEKNRDNNNEYRFKFRREHACITLHHGTQYTNVHVDGNGGDTWWKEAKHILDKQYEVNFINIYKAR